MPEPDRTAEPPSIEALAATFGLDPAGAEVVRSATRHVVRFPATRVRTLATPGTGVTPRSEAAVARLLAEVDVPAARVSAGPELVAGWTVTVWDEISVPDPDAEASATDLGRVAATLHLATAPMGVTGISSCDPLAATQVHLRIAAQAGATIDAEIEVLATEVTRLAPAWHAAVETGALLIHGDLHRGNVVMGVDGPVLVDLELAGQGPRPYDAAPTVAFVQWYGRPSSDVTDFDAAYGAPLTDECATLRLDAVWRLWSASWAIANRHRSPEAEDEALVRLETLRTGTAPRPWILH